MLAALLGLSLLVAGAIPALADCVVDPQETAIFFPSVAVWNAQENVWNADIEGWIGDFKPHSRWRSGLLTLIQRGFRLSSEESENFKRRALPFLADNKKRTLKITLAGKTYTLAPSDAGGHIRHTLTIPQLPAQKWVPFYLACTGSTESVVGQVWTSQASGVVVISDVDDTLKVAKVGQRKAYLRHMLLQDYEAIPGMQTLYDRWAKTQPGTLFYYVSAMPWPYYQELATFLQKERFPRGMFVLKRISWVSRDFFNLFQSPDAYKTPHIEELFQKFPRRRFILVGDSGEKDPEIYAYFARKYPQQVQHIYIRKTGEAKDLRLPSVFKDLPEQRWTAFLDGRSL